jgi:hypothetical protein
MVTRSFPSTLAAIASVFVALTLAPWSANAEEPAAAPAPAPSEPPPAVESLAPAALAQAPRVHHAPLSSAVPGERLTLQATFEHPELIRNAVLVYQGPVGEARAVPFQRSGDTMGYVAVIPAEAIRAPGIGYTIEVEHTNGTRFSAFASRSAKHMVSVIEDRSDARERAALSRLGGRRSVLKVGGEYVGFGVTRGDAAIPCAVGQTCPASGTKVPEVDEQYYRVEVGYTYRPLRTVSEFGFRLGVVRGRSLVALSEYDEERYKVGLNFGAARIRFRLLDAWHVEAELLTSITEIGFSVGLGGSTLIGDPYGSKLILGFESIGLGDSAPFGNRFFTRLDLVAGDRVMISPIVEVTDMPNAEAFGVRLLGEVGISLVRGFSLQLRGGYQARRSTSGGPGFGGALSFAF